MERITESGAKTAPWLALVGLTLGLALLASAGARAANPYTLQPIVALGDTVAGVKLPANGTFYNSRLTDSGQILFDVFATTDRLILYAGGTFTPIAVAGGDGPLGKWPTNLGILGPWSESMNQSGDIVFGALMVTSSGTPGPALGTFLRDSKTQTVTTIALKKMPAAGGLTFTDPGGFVPAINNHGEIALIANVSGPGGVSGYGLFYRAADGTYQTILVPGQALPGGGKAQTDNMLLPSINDAGQVAFLVRRQGDHQDSAYLWESAALTPALVVATDLPGIGKLHGVSSVLLNNKNSSMLVTATIEGSDVAHHGLYYVAGGTVTAVAVPGQAMPDGGIFQTMENVQPTGSGALTSWGVSGANEAGQHAFIARLADGTTAAYLVDADGKLSPLLKSGAVTNLGTITSLGAGSGAGSDISVNTQGEVALVASIDKGPRTLLLLTPASP